MKRTALLFFGLLVLVLSVDYCEVSQARSKLFIQQDESRLLNLNSYLKGYDLTFETDSPEVAKIYSSYEYADTQNINLRDFNSLKSVDVRSYGSLVGLGKLALLAQKDNNKQVALWVGDFTGYQFLPSFSKFKTYTLPSNLAATCFDFRIASDNGEGVLNCQVIPAPDVPLQDLFCYISPNDTELNLGVNCNLVNAFETGIQRKSTVLKIKDRTYLLSRNKQSLQSIDYITVYYYNSNQQFIFVNIIDGSSFQDPVLSITDFVLDKNNQIVIADSHIPRLISYTYSASNQVTVKSVLSLTTKPTALSYSKDSHTLFVASRNEITEYSADTWSVVNVYQVDQSDSLITSVMASDKLLIYSTRNNNLFIYQRQEKKINYLLDRVKLPASTTLVLSNQDRFVFTFNFTHAQTVSIAKPYLQLSSVTSSKTVKITGTSTTKKCEVILDIQYIQDGSNIFTKKKLQDLSFKVDPTQGLNLNLKQFYGGANLKYRLPNNAQQGSDFTSTIKQIESFNFLPTFGQAEQSAILAIDSTSFYMIGVNSIKENMAYVDLCKKTQNSRMNCAKYWSSRVPFNLTNIAVDKITAEARDNGEKYVIWTYKYSTLTCILDLNTKAFSMQVTGNLQGFGYSSVTIANDYFIFVSKTGRRFQIYYNKQLKNIRVDEFSFTPEELKQLEYFYPRQAMLDPNNPKSFFIKLPTKIARFVLLDDYSVKFVEIVRDFGTYQPEKQWSVRPTNGKSILVVRDNTFSQDYYNPAQQKFISLQKIAVDNVVPSTLTYNPQTNFATVSTSGDKNFLNTQTTKILIPEAGSLDAQYCQILSGQAVRVSQNWFLTASSTPQISYINSDPILSVQSNLPDDVFKEDISLTIEIKSGTKSQTSKATVEGFNFPVVIKDVPSGSTIKMPYNTTGSSITIDVSSFYNGPIVDYKLNCPYCKDNITLTPPISLHKKVKQLTGVVDYATVQDRILALSNNNLYLMNQDFEIITTTSITGDHFCRNLYYDSEVGLLLFCTSPTAESGQIVLQYYIDRDRFYFDNYYQIGPKETIRHFDQMVAYQSNDGVNYLIVLDNDETVDTNNKYSTLKVFVLGDQLTLAAEWDSTYFGTDTIYPINDFTLNRRIIFVTLGNYGMGYGLLEGAQILYPANVHLSAIADIKDIFLSSSYFKQIDMVDFNTDKDELSLFITSTNSLSMVIKFLLVDSKLLYQTVSQTYFRYGTQRLLNWHSISKDRLFLSYYNDGSEEVTIVAFNRRTSNRIEFQQGVTVTLSKNLIKYHEAYVTNNGKLLVSHLTDIPEVGFLEVYHIGTKFTLNFAYEKAGNFKTLDFVASNSYHTITHTQKIEFDAPPTPPPPPPPPPPGPDGIKWYVVVIIVASVLLAVGVAYGLFRYKKQKQQQKNVSLLTEREDDTEQDDIKKRPAGDKLNDTIEVEQIKE